MARTSLGYGREGELQHNGRRHSSNSCCRWLREGLDLGKGSGEAALANGKNMYLASYVPVCGCWMKSKFDDSFANRRADRLSQNLPNGFHALVGDDGFGQCPENEPNGSNSVRHGKNNLLLLVR